MCTSFAAPVGAVDLDSPDVDLAKLLFLRALADRSHPHLVNVRLDGDVRSRALPERARVLHDVAGDSFTKVVAEVDDTPVFVETWPRSGEVTVSAADAADASRVAHEIRGRVRGAASSRQLDVRFAAECTSDRTLGVDVPSWDEIAQLYPADVRNALTSLMQHRADPRIARRLLLWHGEPGTGKTTAARALMHAWRDWAGGVVITDPDRLLRSGKYLRQVLLDVDDDERWQLVILEDTDALIRKRVQGIVGVGHTAQPRRRPTRPRPTLPVSADHQRAD